MEEDIAALTVAIEQNNGARCFFEYIHANRLILYLFYRNSLPRF
jgi:hypothetical protein